MSEVEKLAGEYARDWHKDCDYPEEILKHTIEATKTVFMAGYKAGFEIGCMKGSMAMQSTLDSDWHFTPAVDHKKLADQMTKKEMENK